MLKAVAATTARAADYSTLISRSKSVWEWPEGYLKAALPKLQITSEYLAQSSSFEIGSLGQLVGFCALIIDGSKATLDHLWVDPESIGRGVGRFAIKHVVKFAKPRGVRAIDVWPDPPAEGFYDRLGFEFSGALAPSRVHNGPTFRHMSLLLAQS